MENVMNYEKMSTDELGGLFSDYYKDTHGSRPRFVDFNDREELIRQLDLLNNYHDKMQETFEGREQLREDGWLVQETDPELQKMAYFLAKERDKWKLDNWGESGNEARHYEPKVVA
jgi:hypothetical protein